MVNQIGRVSGLLPQEVAKLLASLAKVEPNRVIFRRKTEEKKFGKKIRMDLNEAVEYETKRAEERDKREEKRKLICKKKKIKYVEPP
ncbi:MAG: hypothetical protein ACRC2T_17895, partial [Thermoguttaceae bacterium]